MTEDLIKWLVNQGFAIFVSAFLLIRIESRLKKIEEKIDSLRVS